MSENEGGEKGRGYAPGESPRSREALRAHWCRPGEVRAKPRTPFPRPDWLEVVEWVCACLEKKRMRRHPWPGTRALWKWAKENKSEFFRAFVAKMIPGAKTVQAAQKGEGEEQGSPEEAARALEALRAEFGKKPGGEGA